MGVNICRLLFGMRSSDVFDLELVAYSGGDGVVCGLPTVSS
jgi:hypothetical protein